MEKHLRETDLVNFKNPEIQNLIKKRAWKNLDDFHKVEAIYDFVQNEILFGYNVGDDIPASRVLTDGIGQCNTKATLLIALLRGCGIPARHHAFLLDHQVQKGVIPPSLYPIAPKEILHTWAEVYFEGNWYPLEGVILDIKYLISLQKLYLQKNNIRNPQKSIQYLGYGVGCVDFMHPPVKWEGNATYIQKEGIIQDLGVFDAPDDCYRRYAQKLSPIKAFIYKNLINKAMTKRVEKIRSYGSRSNGKLYCMSKNGK